MFRAAGRPCLWVKGHSPLYIFIAGQLHPLRHSVHSVEIRPPFASPSLDGTAALQYNLSSLSRRGALHLPTLYLPVYVLRRLFSCVMCSETYDGTSLGKERLVVVVSNDERSQDTSSSASGYISSLCLWPPRGCTFKVKSTFVKLERVTHLHKLWGTSRCLNFVIFVIEWELLISNFKNNFQNQNFHNRF